MIHLAVGLLALALVCLGLTGVYPLVVGEGADAFQLTGSVAAVVRAAAPSWQRLPAGGSRRHH